MNLSETRSRVSESPCPFVSAFKWVGALGALAGRPYPSVSACPLTTQMDKKKTNADKIWVGRLELPSVHIKPHVNIRNALSEHFVSFNAIHQTSAYRSALWNSHKPGGRLWESGPPPRRRPTPRTHTKPSPRVPLQKRLRAFMPRCRSRADATGRHEWRSNRATGRLISGASPLHCGHGDQNTFSGRSALKRRRSIRLLSSPARR